MQASRLAIFGVAAVAAIGAGFLALHLGGPAPEPIIISTQPVQPPIKLVEVLVASHDIGMGAGTEGALDWMKWPEDGVSATLIRRDLRPDAITELKGTIARQSFFAGEPIREAKLIPPTGDSCRRSCRRAAARSRSRSRPTRRPAASSCRTTTSTSS